MKKSLIIKSLFLSLILIFTLAMSTLANTSPSITRLSGVDRYSTASQIAKSVWTKSDYAVLAYGENFPDALSAVPLAKKHNAPILLTTSNNLPNATKQTLIDLQVKNVIIIGGTGVISTSVEAELQSMGITPIRIFGQDRYDTAIKVAEQIGSPAELIVVTGEDYPDALSMAPIAGAKQIPIILVPKDYLPDSTKNYISTLNVDKTYVIGDSSIITDNVYNQFPNRERIVGADKYERNIAIDKKFNSNFHSGSICVATGEGFADALTGAVYASKISEPIILVNNDSPTNTKIYYQQRLTNASNVYVFGGTGIVSDSVIQGLGTINVPIVNTPTVESMIDQAKTLFGTGSDQAIDFGTSSNYDDELNTAIGLVSRVITSDPKNALAYCIRARAYNWLYQNQNAIADSEMAIKLDPNAGNEVWNAHWIKGYAYGELKEFDKAVEEDNLCLKTNPNFASGYANCGFHLGKLQKYSEALVAYDKAASIKNDDANIYWNRGVVKNELKNYDGAIADYTKALEIKPDYGDVYADRACAYETKGMFKESLEDARNQVKYSPKEKNAYYNLGYYSALNKLYKDGVDGFAKYISMETDTVDLADGYLQRGLSYEALGEKDLALADYNAAIKLDSSNKDVEKALERLK